MLFYEDQRSYGRSPRTSPEIVMLPLLQRSSLSVLLYYLQMSRSNSAFASGERGAWLGPGVTSSYKAPGSRGSLPWTMNAGLNPVESEMLLLIARFSRGQLD